MLPDEILSEVLSPALKVPDELFCDTSDVSPFSTYAPSTSSHLLVCKDWLRVATPLLYNVVVLRSKSQATALEAALKSNPELGCFIKKLRVEGGYGAAMHTVLDSAPNITDLFLTLSIWSPDSTIGLCRGLPLIDPHRVILVDPCDYIPPKNKQQDALRTTFLECICSWKNLRIFGFPYGSEITWNTTMTQNAETLAQKLVNSEVHTVLLSSSFYGIPPFISTLCTTPSLQVLYFERPLLHAVEMTIDDPKLDKLAQFSRHAKKDTPIEPDISPSLNPGFVPMESASQETRDVVWKHVLFFAMYVEELRSPSFPRRPTQTHPSRLPILSVSRYFNRIGNPYLWESVRLTHYSAPGIRLLLDQRPDLASFILRVYTNVEFNDSPFERDEYEAILSICRHATRLEFFAPSFPHRCLVAPVELFSLLGQTAGHSLQELSITIKCASFSTTLLEPFTALRVLDLMIAGLVQKPTTCSNVLDRVHILHIHEPLLELFANINFGSLHTVELPSHVRYPTSIVNFMAKHGAKLRRLTMSTRVCKPDLFDLGSCPNLVELESLDYDWDITQLFSSTPHQSLVKIIAKTVPTYIRAYKEAVDCSTLDRTSSIMNDRKLRSKTKAPSFEPAMFPALREIQVPTIRLVWPTSERDISKSRIVPVAEALLQKNIKLTNSEGKAWVPRLKRSRREGASR